MTAFLPTSATPSVVSSTKLFTSPAASLLVLSFSLLLAACSDGDVTADPGTGSAGTGPVIGTQPAASTVLQGKSSTFTTATSDTTATYQWRLNGSAATNGAIATGVCAGATVAGATTASMTLSNAPLSCDKSNITVAVTNAGGTTVSSAAALTVVGFTTQPANGAVFANGEVSMTAATSGTAALTYQWKINDVDVADGVVGSGACAGAVASGATTASVKLTSVPIGCNDASLAVVLSLNGETLASQVAKVAVSEVTAAPVAVTVLAGSPATFSVATGGATTLTYAWSIDGQTIGNGPLTTGACAGANVSGATTASVTIASAPVACHNASVMAILTNASNGKFSTSPAALNVAGFGSQPVAPAAFASGTDAVLSAPAGGASLASSTQWFLNGAALTNGIVASAPCAGMSVAGATASTLTLSNIPASCSGVSITSTLTNTLGVLTTTPVVLAVTAGDAKNGTYKAFATNGQIYDLVVDFNTNKFRVMDGANTFQGTLTKSFTVPAGFYVGTVQPDTYTMSRVGSTGLNGALRFDNDVLVGNLQPADGVNAIPFIGARKFVRAATDFGSSLVDMKILGRNFAAAPSSAVLSTVFTARLGSSGYEFCLGNAIADVASCPVGNTFLNYTTTYNADGSVTMVNAVDPTDVVKSYVAIMGTEYVYLRASPTASGEGRLRYGIQSLATLNVGEIIGASTDGSWTTSVASPLIVGVDGVGAGGAVTPPREGTPQVTALPSGLFTYRETLGGAETGASYFAARSNRIVIVMGARSTTTLPDPNATVNGFMMLGLVP
jgi:hypothetical protein